MLKVNCIFKGLMVIDYISIFTEKSTLDVRFSVTLDNSWSQVAGRVMTLFYQLFVSLTFCNLEVPALIIVFIFGVNYNCYKALS